MPNRTSLRTYLSRDWSIPGGLAIFQLALQTAFHSNYGYFRDELYYIACSNHLAFGYVDQPPLSIGILWLSRMILGDSLFAIRLLPAVAGALVVLLGALMARRLGGSRFAQGLASLSIVAAHGLIGAGKTFSMNPFDVLFWALTGYVVIVILTDDRPKLWLLFGLIVGLGLQNKYSVGFMIIGLVAGLLLSAQRKHLVSRWFWLGALIASLLFLPHIIWQVSNGFPSLEFMRNASQEKNVAFSPIEFFIGQVRDINILNAPIWIAGIVFLFFHREGRYRPLTWMYPVIFVVMVAGSAKIYYLYAIYPIYLAAGAVGVEQWLKTSSWRLFRFAYSALLVAVALVLLPLALPVLPIQNFIEYQSALGLAPRADEQHVLAELPQYYADQFGWEEFTDTVAVVYNRLTPEEQARCFIYVRNYGEAAAIDFFGKRYGLPNARCAHNSYWFWGPGERTGDIAIIVGTRRTLQENLDDLTRAYRHVELAATTYAQYAMPYENGRQIFICRGINTTFQKIWASERFFI